MICGKLNFNPFPAELSNLNFHPLEVASRYRDPQLQVGENYSYLFNLRPNIYKSCCLNTHFVPMAITGNTIKTDWKPL